MKKEKPSAKKNQELDAVSEAQSVDAANVEESGAEKGKKKSKKVLNTIINVILIVAIVIAVICTYISFVTTSGNGVPSIFGLRLLSIQTNSMSDTINYGDLIIDTAVEAEDLRKDDIITYWTVINGERVLNTHRIVNIYDGGGFLIFETKGDANTSADPLTVHEREIVGRYQMKIPGLGKVFDYLQTSTGFLIVVVIPVFLFFLYHLVQFFRVLFEYQNIKNRLQYEQERGKVEDAAEAATRAEEQKEKERAALEAELREKLRAEIMASMKKETPAEAPAAPTDTDQTSE